MSPEPASRNDRRASIHLPSCVSLAWAKANGDLTRSWAAPVPSARRRITWPPLAPAFPTYTSDRPSADHVGRRLAVSPKVTREAGPLGSCLIQSALLPLSTISVASAFPSGESDAATIVPGGSQVESTGASSPSRLTHTACRGRAAAPVV